MTNNYYQKQNKNSKKKHVKSIKILLKKKRNQYHRESYKNLSEEQQNELVKYRRNYYITHNKLLLSHFVDFLKIWGQSNLLLHG